MTVTDDRPPAPAAETSDARFVTVRADLLPDEIVVGRRTDAMRRQVVRSLAALVAVLALAYGFSWWQTHQARGELASARDVQTSLQAAQRSFAPLVDAKSSTSSIKQQLQGLMAGDLRWRTLLTDVRRAAPPGVALTQISATVDGATTGTGTTDPAAAAGVLNRSGRQIVGTLTLTGTAPDEKTVAGYADALGRVRGLAAAQPTSLADADHGKTFAMTVPITTDALGGRFSTAAGSTARTGGN